MLDSTYGRVAVGVSALLARSDGVNWEPLAQAEIGRHGYIEEWKALDLEYGTYRIVFDCGRYFSAFGELAAYPEVGVVFRSRAGLDTLQIRLVFSPYSYSVHFGTCQ